MQRSTLLYQLLKSVARVVRKVRENYRIRRYGNWLRSHAPSRVELEAQRHIAANFKYKPLISIVVPTFNTPSRYFREMIKSVLDQTYGNWELIIVDDASTDENIQLLIHDATLCDGRISKILLKKNHHISGATNEAILKARGEFITLFDHDDVLYPDALFEVVKALNEDDRIDFIYTDEDKMIGNKNVRRDPFFKPGLNPDLLWSINYITHMTTIRKRIIDDLGREDDYYRGAQDWELYLRVLRNISSYRVYHIPKILYGWRMHETSTSMSLEAKPYVVESQRKAISDDLRAKGYRRYAVMRDDAFPGQWFVSLTPHAKPRVSIVVTARKSDRIRADIEKKTEYTNYEIVTLNGMSLLEALHTKVTGSYVVIIDDKRIGRSVSPNWIQLMLGDAERKDVGFVAARYKRKDLVFKNITSLVDSKAVPLIKKMSNKEISRHYYQTVRYDVPAVFAPGVTMIETKKLLAVIDGTWSSFDIEKASTKITSLGLYNLYNPYIKVV